VQKDRISEVLFSSDGAVCSDADLIVYIDGYIDYLFRGVVQYEQIGSEMSALHDLYYSRRNIDKLILMEGAFDVVQAIDAMKNLTKAFAVTSFTAQQAADAMVRFGRQ